VERNVKERAPALKMAVFKYEISTRRPATLTEEFRGFSQYIQAKGGAVL
jgi:hypothetical protein